MARQRPLSDPDRAAVYAYTLFRQGRTQAEVRQILGRTLGQGSESAVEDAIRGANVIESRAVGLSLASETDTIGQAAGLPDRAAPPEIRLDVTSTAPGRAPVTHSVIVDYLTADTTVGELQEALEQIAEEIRDQYSGDGAAVTWNVAYVI